MGSIVRRPEPTDEPEIMAMWEDAFDTEDIAKQLVLRESDVERILHRLLAERKSKGESQ